ncbi:MAG: hypothetical protein M0P99_02145 [Candidatus Cloacimonetes bacterium]|nr:hypothetical protein [Candidatus Cloacimonadota bacterium]
MQNKRYDTPILLLIFKRPETTQKVFDQIKLLKPAKLYVFSDAPRDEIPEEKELCLNTRDIINQINWNCELHTLFLDVHLGGCDPAVRTGITWFFECEDMGIILEDDCVPNQDFFWFCQMMLNKYHDELNVMMITGDNPISHIAKPEETYYYSRWAFIWGWATWRRAWLLYDSNITDWPIQYTKLISDKYFSEIQEYREYIIYYCDECFKNPKNGTWDFQWAYCMFHHNGLSITPRENLITNIGDSGVHYSNEDTFGLFTPSTSLDLRQVRHPDGIAPNKFMDTIRFKHSIRVGTKYYYSLKIASIMRKLKLLPRFPKLHPLSIGLWFKDKLSK